MKLVNETPFQAGWNAGFQSDGREVVVVVAKATYNFTSESGQGPVISVEQVPLLETDVFGEDPAFDAPLAENDFGLYKPACDVLVRGCAYAPHGRPTKEVPVGIRVASCTKSFVVVGPRVWQRSALATRKTSSKAFIEQEISYNTAFGGTDIHPGDPSRILSFSPNPVGTGFCAFDENIDQMPLPTSEETSNRVTDPSGKYKPMALGPVGRNWDPRYKFAGTYDDEWLQEKVPLLPDDFNNLYYQAAPADQQIPHPQGGEPIVLVNLSPEGRIQTSIPQEGVYVTFITKAGDLAPIAANLDTIVLDTQANRMCLTWRCSRPMDRDVFELKEMLVEQRTRYSGARVRARVKGKDFYPGLDALVKVKRKKK